MGIFETYYGVFIIEDNELKHGKFVPGAKIPIISKKDLKINDPQILVLAWNFYKEIKKNNEMFFKNIISIKDLGD